MTLNERSALQIAIAIGGCVPVLAGLYGMVSGGAMLGNDANLALDSYVRYLSGILFAIGIAFWHAIPRIEAMTVRCRVLTFIVFIGGLARLYGLIFVGWPSLPMALAIGMELGVTPALCLWQGRIARHYRA